MLPQDKISCANLI